MAGLKSRFDILKSYYTNTMEDGDLELYISQYMSNEEKTIGKPFFLMTEEEQKLYEVMQYNNQTGNLTDYNCMKCKNKGYIKYINDMGYVIDKECSCLKVRKIIQRLKNCGLENLFNIYSFDKYTTTELWQKNILERAKHFINDKDIAFVFLGSSGVGKSHICTALSKELILKGYDFRFMNWIDEIITLKSNRMHPEVYNKIMWELKNVQVLYIDDFLKTDNNTKPTSADISIALEIINYRYNLSRGNEKRYITILSSEKSIEQIREYDEALAGRIKEIAGNYFISLFGTNKNYRFKGDGNGNMD